VRRLAALLVLLCLAWPGMAAERARPTGEIAGHFLVASPSMPDQRFAETVIYMVEHNDQGAMGFVVNRLMGRGPAAIFMKAMSMDPGNASTDISLCYGGPVKPDLILVLHDDGFETGDSQKIGNGLALSGQIDALKAMQQGRAPQSALFIVGYAGWGPGQLEREIEAGSWNLAPYDKEILFEEDPRKTWEKARERVETTL
jgi:putative transcriptional regulator